MGEELRQLREEGKKLLKDNSFLSSKLEEQKKESDSQLDIYKREILTLREELDQEKGARSLQPGRETKQESLSLDWSHSFKTFNPGWTKVCRT